MDETPATATNHAALEQGGLEVVSIAKSYDKRAVLTDISLSVGKGEVLGLLGPNGAGKTTCFYSIMGLVRPDSGRILLDGVDITRLPMYRRAILGLGYLPQETSIFRGTTRKPARQSLTGCSASSASPGCAPRPPWRFRAVSGGAARLPARWRRTLRSSCSMNLSRALTRSRSAISATS
jgi:energy-coupling factor transporter ATP-binding protein EcfA2